MKDMLNATKAATGFDKLWRQSRGSEFTRQDQARTPFLGVFIEMCQSVNGSMPRVLEGGAGSGHHAIVMADEGMNVVAIDASEIAVRTMGENMAQHITANPARDLPLGLQKAHVIEYLRRVEPESLEGVYLNAVLHFFNAKERKLVYDLINRALVPGGVMGVSFKTTEDSLRKLGKERARVSAGVEVSDEGYQNLGIVRLFVEDTNPLKTEMKTVGLNPIKEMNFAVPNYNAGGRYGDGMFVGILATKPV